MDHRKNNMLNDINKDILINFKDLKWVVNDEKNNDESKLLKEIQDFTILTSTYSIQNDNLYLFVAKLNDKTSLFIFIYNTKTEELKKIEFLSSQSPSYRIFSSLLFFDNKLFMFGGKISKKKVNETWLFCLKSFKWTRLLTSGDIPEERLQHSCFLIKHKFALLIGGTDNKIIDIFDLNSYFYSKCKSSDDVPLHWKGSSYSMLRDKFYCFGGLGVLNAVYNDLYCFLIDQKDEKFTASWKKINPAKESSLPCSRNNHCSFIFEEKYFVVVGGVSIENSLLNDIWVYDLNSGIWTEIFSQNSNFLPNFSVLSCVLFKNNALINQILENHNKTQIKSFILLLQNKKEAFLSEITESSVSENSSKEEIQCDDFNKILENNKNDFLVVTNTVNHMSVTNNQLISRPIDLEKMEASVDTSDLNEDFFSDFEILKKTYLNKMISWSFLKKISDFQQWPLGCIGNIIENSLNEKVSAKNIWIDCLILNKTLYCETENRFKIKEKIEYPEVNSIDLKEKMIVLAIKDDGNGIKIKKFNKMIFSFSVSSSNDYNFFKYGISLKSSCLRLGNSFLIISKTETSISIGLISKSLQNHYATEFVLTPIINYSRIEKDKFVPVSDLHNQTMRLIINEVKFLFFSAEELMEYVNSIEKGTHIFVYNLKQFSQDPLVINTRSNYELLFDFERKDIFFNYFDVQIGEKHFIDNSLKTYLKFLHLKQPDININIMNTKLFLANPVNSIFNISKNCTEIKKIQGLKSDQNKCDSLISEGEIYNGFLFNEKFYKESVLTSIHDTVFDKKEVFNGVLLYQKNRLVCRFNQNKLGDIFYFIKKIEKAKDDNIFKIAGFIELPNYFEILPNKMEFKDQALYAYFYSKLNSVLKKIN